MTQQEIEWAKARKLFYDTAITPSRIDLQADLHNALDLLLRQPPPSQTAREIAREFAAVWDRDGEIMVLETEERISECAERINATIDAAVREHNEACAKVADDEWDSSCPVGHELESSVAAAIRSLLPTEAKQEDGT